MLPKGYVVPEPSNNYLKFKQGETRFRIMSDYIVGMEYWKEVDNKRTPVRKHDGERIDPNDLTNVPNPPKAFWACVVYDYEDQKVKILEITQKGLMRTLGNLEGDEDWGDPKGAKGYDLVVTRTGEGMDTKYEVRAKPRKELDPGLVEMYKNMTVNLEALFTGEDPFGEYDSKLADDAEKALG